MPRTSRIEAMLKLLVDKVAREEKQSAPPVTEMRDNRDGLVTESSSIVVAENTAAMVDIGSDASADGTSGGNNRGGLETSSNGNIPPTTTIYGAVSPAEGHDKKQGSVIKGKCEGFEAKVSVDGNGFCEEVGGQGKCEGFEAKDSVDGNGFCEEVDGQEDAKVIDESDQGSSEAVQQDMSADVVEEGGEMAPMEAADVSSEEEDGGLVLLQVTSRFFLFSRTI